MIIVESLYCTGTSNENCFLYNRARLLRCTDMAARLAVLIDADNAQACKTSLLLAETAKFGTAHVKRAYGDWTGTNLKGWKEELLKHSIQPIQQFAYTYGKNATDSAMIIDAMDLLYRSSFDAFCIVSSDSDFTRLAARIRESGLTVYGFGERKTPQPFVTACDKFIYMENLLHHQDAEPEASISNQGDLVRGPIQVLADKHLARLLRRAVEATSGDDGWALLGSVGQMITQQHPDFDPRSYGYKKLSDLINATALFFLEYHCFAEGKSAALCVRDKRRVVHHASAR